MSHFFLSPFSFDLGLRPPWATRLEKKQRREANQKQIAAHQKQIAAMLTMLSRMEASFKATTLETEARELDRDARELRRELRDEADPEVKSYLQDELDRCKQRRLALEPRIAEAQAKVDAMTAKRTRI